MPIDYLKALLLRINISTTTTWPLMPQSCFLKDKYLFKIISCHQGLSSMFPEALEHSLGPFPVRWY